MNEEIIDILLNKVYIKPHFNEEKAIKKREKTKELYMHLDFINPEKLGEILRKIHNLSLQKGNILTAAGMYNIIEKNFPKELTSYYKSEIMRNFLENTEEDQ